MRKVIPVLLCSLILSFSLSAPSGAITNPDGVAKDTPWLASIWVKDSNGGPDIQLCGGTLITPTAILTAAHCVAERQIAYVRFDTAQDPSARKLAVKSRLWHQNYSKDGNVNDIGILRLSEPIDTIIPASLPPLNDTPLRELAALSVVGYGEDQNGTRPFSAAIARQQDLSTEGSVYFDSFNEELMIAAARFVPGEQAYSGACRGDSGGPLFSTFGTTSTIVGVVSYGAADCTTSKPTAYTRVSAYLQWISEALNA